MTILEVLTTTLLVICTIAYLLYFVQKRKNQRFPPGPSGIPLLGYLPFLCERPSAVQYNASSQPHIEIGRIGEKYENIFSLKLGSITVIVLNEVETIKAALKLDAFQGRPNYLPGMCLAKGGIVYNTGEAWKEQRRFSLSTLRDFGFGKRSMDDIIRDDVQNLVEYLRENGLKPFFPRRIFQVSVINSLWSLLTGNKYELDDPVIQKFQQSTYEAFIEPPVAGILYFLPWLVRLFPTWTGFSKMVKTTALIEQMTGDIISTNASTYKEGVTRNFTDVYWKKIVDTKDKNSSFYGEQGDYNFKWTLANLFIAGSDTLSSTLTWAVLYLTTYPEVCEKLYREIVDVVGENELPSIDQRNVMPYTEATMSEILRITTIVPGSVIHDTLWDTEFQDYLIPKGTIIMPNLYAVHFSKTLWGDPKNFRPERFLVKDESGTLQFQKSQNLIPFSTGKRVCVAEGMAMIEFFLFLTGLVQNFKFQFDPLSSKPSLESNCGLVLAPKNFDVSFISRRKL